MNILIVDDDNQILRELKQMLLDIGGSEDTSDFAPGAPVITCCQQSADALDKIREGLCPDLVFMDIQLDDHSDGIGLAGAIRREVPGAQIVFMSGHDDYYLDVYEVEHIWFLRKPIHREQLEKAYQRAASGKKAAADASDETASPPDVFLCTMAHHRTVLNYPEILWFEKYLRKVLIHTTRQEQPFEYYSTMDQLLEKLPDSFVRCHNSYIINLDAVTSYRRGSIWISEQQIPVSRKYESEVREAFYHRLMPRA